MLALVSLGYKMNRQIFIAICVIFVLAAISAAFLAVKQLALAIAFFTFGVGIVFAFAPTPIPYIIAFLPVIGAFPSKRAVALLLPVSVLMAALWAYLPHIHAQQSAQAVSLALARGDSVAQLPLSPLPRTVEIRRPATLIHKMSGAGVPTLSCEHACRALLLSRQVDWVRIVSVSYKRQKNQKIEVLDTFRFVGRVGNHCEAAGAVAVTQQPCIVFAEDTGEPADVVITFTEHKGIPSLRMENSTWFRPVGQRYAHVETVSGGERATVLTRTESHFGLVGVGSIAVAFGGKLEFWMDVDVFNQIDMDGLLRQLGFVVDDALFYSPPKGRNWRDPPTDAETVLAFSAVGLGELSGHQSSAVSKWVTRARQLENWNTGQIELLRSIVNHPQIQRLSDLDQVLGKNPDVAVSLMPDIISISEFASDAPVGSPAFEGAVAFRKIDSKFVKPYASRFLALIKRGGRVGEVMFPLVGRLGVDP